MCHKVVCVTKLFVKEMCGTNFCVKELGVVMCGKVVCVTGQQEVGGSGRECTTKNKKLSGQLHMVASV